MAVGAHHLLLTSYQTKIHTCSLDQKEMTSTVTIRIPIVNTVVCYCWMIVMVDVVVLLIVNVGGFTRKTIITTVVVVLHPTQ